MKSVFTMIMFKVLISESEHCLIDKILTGVFLVHMDQL